MVLVLLAGGELVDEFRKLATVYIVNSPSYSLPARIWSKLHRMAGKDHSNILNSVAAHAPDLIFVNSITAITYGMKIRERCQAKLICNIHELDTYALFYTPPGGYSEALHKAEWLMMGSQAVQNFYIDNFKVDPKKTSVIYDFIADENPQQATAADIRQLYGIPVASKIVGGIGTLDWRKGKELFLCVAREVIRRSPNTYFVWVGGNKKSVEFKQFEREVRLFGLADRVILTGEQADIHSYYEAFDVFLLTSREDPFPLVCLESAVARTPVICFAKAGGMPEFVRDDAGFVVDYVDIDQMAEKTLLLLNDEALRRQMGAVARERALQNHTIGKLGPSILELIERTL